MVFSFFDPETLFWAIDLRLRPGYVSFILTLGVLVGSYIIPASITSPEKYNRLKVVAVNYGLCFIGWIICSVAYLSYCLGWDLVPSTHDLVQLTENNRHTFVLILLTQLSVFFCFLLVKRKTKYAWESYGLKKPESGNKSTVVAIIIGILAVALTNLLWMSIYGEATYHEKVKGFIFGKEQPLLLASAILVVIASTLINELFYRGMLLPIFEACFGFKVGLLLQALLAWLFVGASFSSMNVFVSAIIYGAIYKHTRSLIPVFISHLTISLLVFL